jgi:hypothetical protein
MPTKACAATSRPTTWALGYRCRVEIRIHQPHLILFLSEAHGEGAPPGAYNNSFQVIRDGGTENGIYLCGLMPGG